MKGYATMKKRVISIAALLLSATIILTACGGDVVELMEFIDSNPSSVDYGGYKFQYYFGGDSSYDATKTVLGYDTNTIQGEAMLKRIDDIKKQLNVEIVLNPQYDYTQYRTMSLGGNLTADAFSYNYMNAMQVFASGGFLHPITEFPDYIDLKDTDKYGAANVLEPAMVNSVPYAVLPCFWPGNQPMEDYVYCYNKDMLSANGLTDLHEFWENETWTWETYEKEFLEKAKIETADGYRPAISTYPIAYFDMLMYSNNVQFVKRNNNGENIANPYPDEFVQAYEQGLDWVQEYPEIVDISLDMHDIDPFLEEMTLSALIKASDVTQGAVAYKESSFLYGIMPFPAGPNAPYGVWAQVVERIGGIGIAITSIEPNIAAHTLSLWFEPFEEFGGRDGLYDFYNTNTFLSETDTEIFFALMEHVRYDYTFWDQSDVGREVASAFGTSIKQGRGISEAMEKNRNLVDKMVYDYILPNFDYMYDNYYYQFDN